MTQAMREKMLEALRGSLPNVPAVITMLTEDIDALEPIIAEIERNAEARGRFQTWLEVIAARQARIDGDKPVDVVEHSHPCEICGDAVSCWCPLPDDNSWITCNRHAELLPF